MRRPFLVKKIGNRWWLFMHNVGTKGSFPTAGEAIDHAYKNWPWYL